MICNTVKDKRLNKRKVLLIFDESLKFSKRTDEATIVTVFATIG